MGPLLSRFPRLYAAASLKQDVEKQNKRESVGFPRLYAAASLKQESPGHGYPLAGRFSAALCRGLIEASSAEQAAANRDARFPRLYAAASLKLFRARYSRIRVAWFSAALCRGLIEAGKHAAAMSRAWSEFSAALCRGLIEAGCTRRI